MSSPKCRMLAHELISIFISILQKIEKPFLNAVSATLGDRYTENVEGIYNITIKFIIETLVEGFSNSQNGHYVANSSKNSIKNTTISNNSDGANKTNSLSGDTQTKCSRPKPSSDASSWAS